MENAQHGPEVGAAGTVQQDWLARLPEEKCRLFEDVLDELEVSYIVLSVALHDAFAFCDQGQPSPALEQAARFSDLFDRLAGRLRGVLRTLDEHGRHFGTHPRVAPLQAGLFRSDCAQSVVRANSLLALVALRRPSRFFRKLAALDELVATLAESTRGIVAGMARGAALGLPHEWRRLEVLHHDLNTCFCESSIVLKSFLCAMPGRELSSFRLRLLALVPTTMAVRPGRPPRFATGIIFPCEP